MSLVRVCERVLDRRAHQNMEGACSQLGFILCCSHRLQFGENLRLKQSGTMLGKCIYYAGHWDVERLWCVAMNINTAFYNFLNIFTTNITQKSTAGLRMKNNPIYFLRIRE